MCRVNVIWNYEAHSWNLSLLSKIRNFAVVCVRYNVCGSQNEFVKGVTKVFILRRNTISAVVRIQISPISIPILNCTKITFSTTTNRNPKKLNIKFWPTNKYMQKANTLQESCTNNCWICNININQHIMLQKLTPWYEINIVFINIHFSLKIFSRWFHMRKFWHFQIFHNILDSVVQTNYGMKICFIWYSQEYCQKLKSVDFFFVCLSAHSTCKWFFFFFFLVSSKIHCPQQKRKRKKCGSAPETNIKNTKDKSPFYFAQSPDCTVETWYNKILFVCYIRYFVVSVVNKQSKCIQWDQRNSLLYQAFCYVSLYEYRVSTV